MEIIKNIQVPTGNILISQGEKNKPLEFLSIGDYGKDKNIIADHMGLSRKIEKVEHSEMMPLYKKWVITVSTQYGCSMNCSFCDVPKVGPGINASLTDLLRQIDLGLSLHPEIAKNRFQKVERLNIHYARMGEPTWNPHVLESAIQIHSKFYGYHSNFEVVHPVVSTMMPKKNPWLSTFIRQWMNIKNNLYEGNAGLQLSINSTNHMERDVMFNSNALTINDISELMKEIKPKGRKITLNFAVAHYTVNAEYLAQLFNPDYYIVKLTPMHKTFTALKNKIETDGDYSSYHPYEKLKHEMEKAGFEVIVFIASEEEDLGRITCGNAILSGSMPECEYKIL